MDETPKWTDPKATYAEGDVVRQPDGTRLKAGRSFLQVGPPVLLVSPRQFALGSLLELASEDPLSIHEGVEGIGACALADILWRLERDMTVLYLLGPDPLLPELQSPAAREARVRALVPEATDWSPPEEQPDPNPEVPTFRPGVETRYPRPQRSDYYDRLTLLE